MLRGGCVLTLDPKVGNFRRADVLIEDGRISEVGTGLRARDAETVDASDAIVMPGFVDTHRHVWESLFRNLGDEAPIADPGSPWSSAATYGPHFGPEDVYAGESVGLLGAIDAGITTVVDWSNVHATPDHTDAVVEAIAASGMRTVLAYGSPPWAPPHSSWERRLGDLAAAHRPHGDGLMSVALAAVGPELGPTSAARSEWELARRLGLRIHVHVGTGDAGRGGGLEEMARAGLLGGDTTYVHCTTSTEADLDHIAATGGAVSVTAFGEMMRGRGMPPIQRFLDKGIRPGLGVDTEGSVPGDMFTQMRTVISLQHAAVFDLKLAGKAGLPGLLTTRDVLRFATGYGAAAAGLSEVVGTLTPGKQADVIVLRGDRPNVFPINDPIGAVVWGMDTSNVEWVFVAGKALKRHGVLDADVEPVRRTALAAQRRVAEASGLLVGAGGQG